MPQFIKPRVFVNTIWVWVIAGLGIAWQAYVVWDNWPLPLHAQPFPTLGLIPVASILALAWLRIRSADREAAAIEESRRFLLNRLLSIEEEERHKIAGEIHDDTIQIMVAALMYLDSARATAVNPNTINRLNKTIDLLRPGLERTRTLMFEMAPAVLNHHGIKPAIQALVADTADETGAAMCGYTCTDKRFEPAVEAMVFRLVREALANVKKHSGATQFSVNIKSVRRGLVIEIVDNGQGFDVDKAMARVTSIKAHKSLGLASIFERCALAGGKATVESRPGHTVLTMEIPVSYSKRAAA